MSKPLEEYPDKVADWLRSWGYRDCPVCLIASGRIHLGSLKLWEGRLSRVDHTDSDPVSGFSRASILAHIKGIKEAGSCT